MDLSNQACHQANIETGDRVNLTLQIAETGLPEELARLLKQSPQARARWEALTPGQQRMLREEILAAKQVGTRERRAARALGLSVNHQAGSVRQTG
ncbi:MAG: YdeI/OmpD-associated family protein [Acidobacteriota bacterium]